jgi:hypothetical protein
MGDKETRRIHVLTASVCRSSGLRQQVDTKVSKDDSASIFSVVRENVVRVYTRGQISMTQSLRPTSGVRGEGVKSGAASATKFSARAKAASVFTSQEREIVSHNILKFFPESRRSVYLRSIDIQCRVSSHFAILGRYKFLAILHT